MTSSVIIILCADLFTIKYVQINLSIPVGIFEHDSYMCS